MRIQLPFWPLAIIAVAVTSCGSLDIEAGFERPAELTATAEAQLARPSPTSGSVATAVGRTTEVAAASTTSRATFEASHATYQPPSPDGRLITPDEAKARVRTFLGEAASGFEEDLLEIIGWPQDKQGRSFAYVPKYSVRRRILGVRVRYLDQLTVDAKTGEVMDATLSSNTFIFVSKQPVAEADAKAAAETFARTRFAGFEQLALVKAGRWVPPDGDPFCPSDDFPFCADPQYGIAWAKRAPDSGVWLPINVGVNINLKTGAMSRYNALRVDYTGPTAPAIDRDRAIKLALEEARKDPQLATATVDNVHLAISAAVPESPTLEGQYRLNWFVGFVDAAKGKFLRHFSVDALDGTILNPVGTPLG